MRVQSIAAKIASSGFAGALAVALAASYGTRLGWWGIGLGLDMLIPSMAIGLVGLIGGVIWLVRALKDNTSAGWRLGITGLIGSAIVFGIPANDVRLFFIAPPIHDISTDVEYAPPFEALLALRKGASNGPEYDGPKAVVYQGKRMTTVAAQKKAYPDVIPYAGIEIIRPGSHDTPKSKLFWHAFAKAQAMGWNIVAFDEKTGRIEATDTSFWFVLTDDIVIRVRPAGTLGARLDIRSKSRFGTSDLGRNAQRIRDYRKLLPG